MSTGDPQIPLVERRLTLLRADLHQPHSRPVSEVRPPGHAAHSPSPINLGVLEQIERARNEVVDEVRRARPAVGPAPEGSGLYTWLEDSTAGLADQRAQVRAAMAYRHSLQYAIAAGDIIVIRKEACPSCARWSLLWDRERQRAVCGVKTCLDKRGRRNAWSLAQIAEKAVERFADRAAT